MKHYKYLLLLTITGLQLACGQQTSVDNIKKEKQPMTKKLDVNSENTFDKEAPKHGYYLQIN
ncbi:hypothetical protein, partial [Tenacibaculum maritimum]